MFGETFTGKAVTCNTCTGSKRGSETNASNFFPVLKNLCNKNVVTSVEEKSYQAIS